MMEKLNKLLPLITFIMSLGVVAGAIYWAGGFVTEITKGQLNPTEKVEVMQMVREKPSEVDSYKMWQKVDTVYDRAMNAFIKDELATTKSRDTRDSTLQVALDRADANAVTIYTLKEQSEIQTLRQIEQTMIIKKILTKLEQEDEE